MANEVSISSFKPEVQIRIMSNQKKFNPNGDNQINTAEIGELLKTYGANDKSELQNAKPVDCKTLLDGYCLKQAQQQGKSSPLSIDIMPKQQPPREKRKISGVTFYTDEVLDVQKTSYNDFLGREHKTAKVTTPYGTFEYVTDNKYENQSGNGSILGNKVKNVMLHSYSGTEGNDKIYLRNSFLAHINIKNGGKDIISYDKNSYGRDISYIHADSDDEIRFYKEDGSYKVVRNPYE